MKVYIVTQSSDDFETDISVKPFLTQEAAQAAMEQDLKDTLELFGLKPDDEQNEKKQWGSDANSAYIRYDIMSRYANWSIEEHDLPVKLAVRVHNGMVQEAVANADIDLDVFDLDTQEMSEDGKTHEADRLDAEYKKLSRELGWRVVY